MGLMENLLHEPVSALSLREPVCVLTLLDHP